MSKFIDLLKKPVHIGECMLLSTLPLVTAIATESYYDRERLSTFTRDAKFSYVENEGKRRVFGFDENNDGVIDRIEVMSVVVRYQDKWITSYHNRLIRGQTDFNMEEMKLEGKK